MLMIIHTLKDDERRQVTMLARFNNWLRTALWTRFINKALFYSLAPP